MICTSVVPCLSSGLAKNNKTMSMFVLFSRLFYHFESLADFPNYTKAVRQHLFSQFLKGTTIIDNFFKNERMF